jgi:hypothetical protein
MGSPRADASPSTKPTPPTPSLLLPAAAFATAKAAAAPGIVRSGGGQSSRPCLYCGRTFADREELKRHELWEAAEFEREALDFEMTGGVSIPGVRNGSHYSNNRVNQSDFESQSERFQQLIDRTDEEFGDDSCNGYSSTAAAATSREVPRSVLIVPLMYRYQNGTTACSDDEAVEVELTSQQQQCSHTQAAAAVAYNTQYNHTSQYTSLDPGGPVAAVGESPPPAHEGDQLISQHGFLPPPPPLPVPQFAALGCHNRGWVEFPDPNEERTYTRLTSKDETHTCTSLLQVNNSMSPSREVLDLSLPKPSSSPSPPVADETSSSSSNNNAIDASSEVSIKEDNLAGETAAAAVGSSDVVSDENSAAQANCDTSTDCSDDKTTVKPEPVVVVVDEPHQQLLLSDESTEEMIVYFEPGSVPSLPAENLTACVQAPKVEDAQEEEKLILKEEWKDAELNGDYASLMEEDEEEEEDDKEGITATASSRTTARLSSPPPRQFDDPNRIDCRFCGMIFAAPHVRQFHEASHEEEAAQEEEEYEGEATRLFCGFCGKTFKKAQYRLLHEKGHTCELAIGCAFCDRRFRWESELRAHNRLFCTAERPAKPLSLKKVATTPSKAAAATVVMPKVNGVSTTAGSGAQLINGHSSPVRGDDQWRPHPNLPAGWRQRSRPRPEGGGQTYLIYMAPGGQIFHSRRAVLQHMEASGGAYSRDELRRMKAHTGGGGPRGRRPKSLLAGVGEEEESNNSSSLDTSSVMDTSGSSHLDYDTATNGYDDDDLNGEDDDEMGSVEGKRKKSRRSGDQIFAHKRRVTKA